MTPALPLTTVAIIGVPTTLPPLRTVNVTLPSLTVATELVTEALRATVWAAALKSVKALTAAVVVAAGPTVRTWLASDEPRKLAGSVVTAWMV